MNYGETLAYWYLRLNGFFPLKNFVLHSSRREERPTQSESYIQGADCDLIAVRFPHVYEEVGGQPGREEDSEDREGDWDSRFSAWGFSLKTEVIGLIVEVKTGDLNGTEELKSFRKERIKADIQRMGMFDKKSVEDDWVENLSKHAVFPVPGDSTYYRVGKLLVSQKEIRRDRLEQREVDSHVLNITLRDVDDFIRKRIQKYKDRKNRDRILFPDDLLQYLLWKQET